MAYQKVGQSGSQWTLVLGAISACVLVIFVRVLLRIFPRLATVRVSSETTVEMQQQQQQLLRFQNEAELRDRTSIMTHGTLPSICMSPSLESAPLLPSISNDGIIYGSAGATICPLLSSAVPALPPTAPPTTRNINAAVPKKLLIPAVENAPLRETNGATFHVDSHSNSGAGDDNNLPLISLPLHELSLNEKCSPVKYKTTSTATTILQQSLNNGDQTSNSQAPSKVQAEMVPHTIPSDAMQQRMTMLQAELRDIENYQVSLDDAISFTLSELEDAAAGIEEAEEEMMSAARRTQKLLGVLAANGQVKVERMFSHLLDSMQKKKRERGQQI